MAVFRDRANRNTLVLYDEENDGNHRVVRRAILLEPNRSKIRAHEKPDFVPIADVERMKLLPREPHAVSPYDLPRYDQPSAGNCVALILLTPFGLVFDSLQVAGCVGLLAFEAVLRDPTILAQFCH
jgi:hypothetical protein